MWDKRSSLNWWDDSQLYAPNVFSPSSVSGNDIFYLRGSEKVEEVIDFYIFDRWGNKVFEDHNFQPNDKEHGWDGVFLEIDGVTGVYVYLAIYKGCSDETSKLVGDVTLLR